jgi:predicted peroxiredoxin
MAMAKILISITYAKDNPDKATVAMVVANAALVCGQEAVVFLSSEGVRLAVRGYAEDIHEEGFAPMRELLNSFIENGGTIWVCTPCFKKRGLTEANLVSRATLIGGATVVEALAQGAACLSY